MKTFKTTAQYSVIKEQAIAMFEDLMTHAGVRRYDALELAADKAFPKTLKACMLAAGVTGWLPQKYQIEIARQMYYTLQADIEEFMHDKVAQMKRGFENA